MPDSAQPIEPQSLFVTTRWSIVVAARDKASPHSDEALEALCRAYWYPLYVFVRRQGHSPHDAQDLTQAFFARLLAKDYLQAATKEKGRFRTFLLVALKRFLINEWDRVRAQKRGGGREHINLDTTLAEQRYQLEPTSTLPADRIFERRWAMTLLDQAMVRLRAEYDNARRVKEFEHLKDFLTAERGGIPYVKIAEVLEISEGTARVSVHRLRKRFREVFREEIAQTVSEPKEIEDEIRYVVSVLSQA